MEGINPDGTEKYRGLTYSDFAILIRSIHTSNGDNRDKMFSEALERHSIPYRTTGEGGIFDRPYAMVILDSMELLRNEGLTREMAISFYENTVLPIFPDASESSFLNVLHIWNQNIHAPYSGSRRKVYPQAFLHDLIDAFNVRKLGDETALRDLGLFSKISSFCFQLFMLNED